MNDEATGSVTHPLGTEAAGVIIYSPDGYMSAQLVGTQSGDADPTDPQGSQPPAETSDPVATAGQLAYSGPFTVDGTTGWIAHHLSVCSLPEWRHGTQHRLGVMDGDRLTLSFTRTDHAGARHTSTLTWQRLAPQTPRHDH